MKKQEIIEEVRQLKERLALLENQLEESQEELEEKYVPWIPSNDDEEFYYISGFGFVEKATFDLVGMDKFVLKLSNNHSLFKTKELAEERKLLSPLERKLAFILDQLGRDESKIAPAGGGAYFFYDYIEDKMCVDWIFNRAERHKSQYTTSEEMILKAVKLMGDDAYRYCGVEPQTNKKG